MSLFDVIKYPISDTPTEMELENLPIPLFNEWVKEYWFPLAANNGRDHYPDMIARALVNNRIRQMAVSDLRQRILRIDNDNI